MVRHRGDFTRVCPGEVGHPGPRNTPPRPECPSTVLPMRKTKTPVHGLSAQGARCGGSAGLRGAGWAIVTVIVAEILRVVLPVGVGTVILLVGGVPGALAERIGGGVVYWADGWIAACRRCHHTH